MFCKICVLKNFVKFTGKQLCQSLLFNKVAGLRLVTLLKKRLWQMFSCEFREIFRNTFFIEHLRWLLLNKTYKKMSVWSPWNYFFSSSFWFFYIYFWLIIYSFNSRFKFYSSKVSFHPSEVLPSLLSIWYMVILLQKSKILVQFLKTKLLTFLRLSYQTFMNSLFSCKEITIVC